MSYVVKYIGNCARNNVDIRPLYSEDIMNGERVVLVCEKENSAQYFGDEVKLIDSITDAVHCEDKVMLLRTSENARVLAVECAFSLYAHECQVYIKYNGLFSADPSETEYAQRIEKIDYDEVSEMCVGGYSEVDEAMIEDAKKRGVTLHLLSYNEPLEKGTIVREVLGMGTEIIKGVIKNPDVCIITLMNIPDTMGITYRIFQAISDARIVVDIISLPVSHNGRRDISFTVERKDKKAVQDVLLGKKEELGFSELVVNDNVAKISIVGAALQTNHGVASTLFKIMYENDINLRLITTSEIKIAFIVDKLTADLAVQKIHEVFIK